MSQSSALNIHDSKTEFCPSCKKEMPVYRYEPKWCPHCEWNLVDDGELKGFYDNVYRSLGKKFAKDLFNQLSSGQTIRPRLTSTKVIAYSLATLIHSLTFIVLGCAFLVFFYFPILIASLMSLVLLGIAWSLRPRFRKWPRKDILDHTDYRDLYKLADEISNAMKTSRFDGIVIDEHFNAYYTEYSFLGFRKKKLLGIGLPLLEILSAEEIVSVIAHEASHGANGDVARGSYIGSALNSLSNWHLLLCPAWEHEGYSTDQLAFSNWLANKIGELLSLIPWATHYLLVHLLLRESQECEYLADRLASEVAGSEPIKSFLRSLRKDRSFEALVQKTALADKKNVFSLLDENNLSLPSDHELDRLNRIEEKSGLSFDTTHPPTSYRIKFIDSFPSQLPRVKLSVEEFQQIKKQFEKKRDLVNTKLIDTYMDSIT